MKIGKENIESFIFDYHEGNLSDSEKTEVLNYIHAHPEYEVEFTQWAQSYLPFENTIKNYGITNKLLQPSPTLWYNKTWIKITAPTLLLAFATFFYFTSQESISTSEQQNKHTPSIHPITKTKANTITENKNSYSENRKQTSITNTSTSYYNNQPTDEHRIDSTMASTHTENITPVNTSSNKEVQENKITSLDTLTNNTNAIAPNNKTNVSKKRKPYKIKPTTDFIPTNPDF